MTDITVQVSVLDIPWWQWPWRVPRNVPRRWRWLYPRYRRHGLVIALMAVLFLSTKDIRVGNVAI